MKRIAVKLVVFLLLGAVVNVAVAWGCATLVDFDWRQKRWQSSAVYLGAEIDERHESAIREAVQQHAPGTPVCKAKLKKRQYTITFV